MGDTADRAVGSRADRCLVDDAFPVLCIDAIGVAPLLREDVVDVDREVDVLNLVERFVFHPVASTPARMSAAIPL